MAFLANLIGEKEELQASFRTALFSTGVFIGRFNKKELITFCDIVQWRGESLEECRVTFLDGVRISLESLESIYKI